REKNLPWREPRGNVTFSPYYQHSGAVAGALVAAYGLLFVACVAGNALVCLTVLRSRRMRTATNTFILNLAVSDLLVGIFCMPTTLVDNLITGWPFGNAMCKMSGLVQGMSVSASVFTLVAIAVERFRCIVHPLREKLTPRKALATIAAIWALSLAIMSPSAATLTVTREERHLALDAHNVSHALYACWEAWPRAGMRRAYTAVLFAHIYAAPLALMVALYARVALKLCAAAPAAAGERVPRRKARVVHMLVAVALVFTLSWLPLWTLTLLADYGRLSERQLRLVAAYAFPLAHWLAFLNSGVNPVIYGYFNGNFRRGFREAFRAPCRAASPSARGHGRAALFGARNRVFATAAAHSSDSDAPPPPPRSGGVPAWGL
uniref:Neuropeptide FF receptor 1 n=1 Tax=Nothoprocta perdicaria TaxID=30464 RepID=A0A8C7EEI1_NOTPE